MSFFGIYFGSPLYLLLVWGISAVLDTFGVLIFRKNIRLRGFVSWATVLLLGGLGGLLAMPVVDVLNLGIWYAIPLFAMATIISVPWIHFGLTKVAPDMNIDVFAASLMLGFMVGVAVLIAGYTAGEIEAIGTFDIFSPAAEPFPT